ncbi:MAG: gliding motility protein GldN [Aureispira sp.]|nr:gliding motility protein GldN [Aureispira sp.]
MKACIQFLRPFALVFGLIAFTSTIGFSQDNPNITESGNTDIPAPRDNFYDRYIYKEKRVLDYDHIHEKDVFWEKRIWRLVDVREKMNHIFTNEKAYFINIILDAAKKDDISLYHVFDDQFTQPMTQEERQTIGTSVDTIITFNPDTFDEEIQVVVNELDPTDVKKYRLKEVWYFDEETSSMGVRILGVAPIIDRYDDNGNFLNSGPMFWAYYPELRETLARSEAFNPHNDAARMSWEDIFEARLFSSYIVKESNVYDRRIKDYKTSPIDVLLEADKIKNEVFHFEHDLWSY